MTRSGALIAFYKGDRDVIDTVALLNQAMEDLACQRANVAKVQMPELDFGQ
jgi:hypothetical protein